MEIKKYLKTLVIAISAIFFCGIFYYYYFIADHLIYYQNEKVLFLFDSEYFKSFLAYPGGLAEYLSAFISQFFFHKWVGVTALTLLAFAASLFTRLIYIKLNKNRIVFFELLPALLLVSLYSGESLLLFVVYILSSFTFLAYLSITRSARKYIFAGIAFILLYLVAAAFSFVFLLSCVIYELSKVKKKNDLFSPAVYILLAMLIPLLSWLWVFPISFNDALLYHLPLDTSVALPLANIAITIFLPLLIVISLIRLPRKFSTSNSIVKISIPLLLFALLSIYVFKNTITKDQRVSYLIDKMAEEGDWTGMLQFSAMNPTVSDINAAYTNLALFHTGNLPWDMFRFVQLHNENGLIPKWRNSSDILLPGSQIYFDLGLSNGAYRWAFESLVVEGPTYRALKTLILTSLINKDYLIAEKYLSILEKTLFYEKWAKKYKRFLFNDSVLGNDPVLGVKQKQLSSDNSFITIINNGPNLKLLLRSNPANRMAFEYLMAHYLLKKDLEGFAGQLDKISNFEYSALPKSYEEALLVYRILNDTANINLGGLEISENTMRRFEAYSEAFPKYRTNREMGAKALRAQFGDTYWYYHHYVDLLSSKERNSQKIDR